MIGIVTGIARTAMTVTGIVVTATARTVIVETAMVVTGIARTVTAETGIGIVVTVIVPIVTIETVIVRNEIRTGLIDRAGMTPIERNGDVAKAIVTVTVTVVREPTDLKIVAQATAERRPVAVMSARKVHPRVKSVAKTAVPRRALELTWKRAVAFAEE